MSCPRLRLRQNGAEGARSRRVMFSSVMRKGNTCTWKRFWPPLRAAVTRRQISSTTGSVMAKQPIEAQPPCTITNEPVRLWARSKSVGKAQVEGAVEAAGRIERLGVDRVEAFRRLAVSLLELGAEPARPAADRIGGEALEAIPALQPQLELELALEDADEDGRAERHALRRPAGLAGRAGRACRQAASPTLACASRRDALGLDLDGVPVGEEVAATMTAATTAENTARPSSQLAQDAPARACAARCRWPALTGREPSSCSARALAASRARWRR